jgi:hypothetical protein
MNFDSAGNAAAERAGTIPCRESVMFGCVNVKGDVETEATCIPGDAESVGSMETSKGREGVDRSRSYGTGLIAVAVPRRKRVSDLEVILNEVRVTSLEKEGKGVLPPEPGNPGIEGTGKSLRKCDERDSETRTLHIYDGTNVQKFLAEYVSPIYFINCSSTDKSLFNMGANRYFPRSP